MKISSMTISNLYSYSYTKANFEDFNIVVGHNVAGKTNLIRILKILVKDPGVRKGEKYIPISFDSIELSQKHRLNPDKASLVMLELLLSRYEIKILLQFLFQRAIVEEDNLNYDFLQKVNLIIYWVSTPNDYQPPEFVLVRFANDFAVWRHKNQDRVGFINNIPDTADDLQSLLAAFKNLSPQNESNIYHKIGFTYEKWLRRFEFQDPFLRGNSLDLFKSNLEVNNYMHYDSLNLSYSISQPQQYISRYTDSVIYQRNILYLYGF